VRYVSLDATTAYDYLVTYLFHYSWRGSLSCAGSDWRPAAEARVSGWWSDQWTSVCV